MPIFFWTGLVWNFLDLGKKSDQPLSDGDQGEQVISLAVRGAKIYGLCFLANGFNIVQSGYHTALGDAVSSILIAASRGIVFVPIGLALFSRILGIDGVWVSLPFAEVVTVGVCFWIGMQKRKQRGLAEMMGEENAHNLLHGG